jgi:hypothetical protein
MMRESSMSTTAVWNPMPMMKMCTSSAPTIVEARSVTDTNVVAGDFLAHSADQTLPKLLGYLGASRAGDLWFESFRYIPPTVVCCVISGWVVGRPVLFYAASVFVALLVGVTAIAWYAAPVAVPHALFYVVILALPYWWWSGLLIVPALIVIGGPWRVGPRIH